MIVNAYSILDGFVALLRLGLAVPVVILALTTWRRWKRTNVDDREAVENRMYLVLLLAGLLLILNMLAWPLFYLLLQSYVPEWPGVMCIYGVTRIGAGTVGPARHLPAIVAILQTLKPLVVFLSGAWFVLHLVNRRTRTAPLTGRVLIGVLAASIVSVADAGTELAYLVIPKKEEFLSGGCCTTAFDGPTSSRYLPTALLDRGNGPGLTASFLATNTLLTALLIVVSRVNRQRVPAARLVPLVCAATVNFLVSVAFLTEIAAPRLLQMPDHHCAYDLVERAPRAVVAVAGFLVSTLAIGWAAVAGWFGRDRESAAFAPRVVGGVLRMAAGVHVASLILLAAELLLA